MERELRKEETVQLIGAAAAGDGDSRQLSFALTGTVVSLMRQGASQGNCNKIGSRGDAEGAQSSNIRELLDSK